MIDFDTAFDRLMGHEGGYTNNANDPGGETNWGISKRAYPTVDIKGLTRDQAKLIYKRDFWDAVGGDRLWDGLAFQLFDFAVNSGISTAIRTAQQAAGVADDGHWGPITSAAVAALSESAMIMRLNALRLDFMTRLSQWDTFGKGWARRISKNLLYGAEDS